MSTYPCLESPVRSPRSRPLPSPIAKVRGLALSVLLTAAASRTAKDRSDG